MSNVVGPIETLTSVVSKLQEEVAKMRTERDISKAEVLRLRRLLARVLGQLQDQAAIDRISSVIKAHEGDRER